MHNPIVGVGIGADMLALAGSDPLTMGTATLIRAYAGLIAAPVARGSSAELPHLTLASDLHNNLLALPALDRAVGQNPLFFAGDLTSSGSDWASVLFLVVDFLFVAARFANDKGKSDVLWVPGQNR